MTPTTVQEHVWHHQFEPLRRTFLGHVVPQKVTIVSYHDPINSSFAGGGALQQFHRALVPIPKREPYQFVLRPKNWVFGVKHAKYSATIASWKDHRMSMEIRAGEWVVRPFAFASIVE